MNDSLEMMSFYGIFIGGVTLICVTFNDINEKVATYKLLFIQNSFI